MYSSKLQAGIDDVALPTFVAPNYPSWILPEIELLQALLERAFLDLRHDDTRADALEWINDEETTEQDVMSFRWVCSHLNVNFDLMRRKVSELRY